MNMDYKQYKLGVQPSPIDERDYLACAIIPKIIERPLVYEIKDDLGVLNQGEIGSCVAFSSSSGLSTLASKIFGKLIKFSQGFIYGNRLDSDSQSEGMVVREALSQLTKCGNVLFNDMPMNDLYPNCKAYIKNHPELMNKALPYKLPAYARAYTTDEIKDALLANHPVLCVIAIFDSFYTTFKDGIAPDYAYTEGMHGFHCVEIIGYDDNRQAYKVKNSWDKDWQLNGYFYLKYNNTINSNEYWAMIWDKEIPKPVANTYYRVQLGAYKFAENCDARIKELYSKHGISACRMFINGLYKCQAGSFINKSNAEAMRDKLIGLGYKDAFITTIQK